MIAALVLTLVLHAPAPQRDSWFGVDKTKHFLMSAFVHSAAFSCARLAGGSKTTAQIAGATSAGIIGVWKEFHDRAQQKPFSAKDLAWDAAGALAAASLLNGAR